MSSVIGKVDQPKHATRLSSWRALSLPERTSTRRRWCVAVGCGILVTAFLSLIASPLGTPKIHVTIVGPAPGTTAPTKGPSPGVSSNSPSDQDGLNLALRASEQVRKFATAQADRWNVSGRTLSASGSIARHERQVDAHIVYAVGVPVVVGETIRLCESGSGRSASGIDLRVWLDSMGRDPVPTLLLIDCIVRSDVDVAELPEWTQLRVTQVIERQLAAGANDSLTVVVQFTDSHSSQAHARVLAGRLDGVFGEQADSNHDGCVSMNECRAALVAVAHDKTRRENLHLFGQARSTRIRSVTLAKYTTDDSAGVAEKAGETVTRSASVIDPLPEADENAQEPTEREATERTGTKLTGLAPTMAAAIALADQGIFTEQVESARALRQELTEIGAADLPAPAIAWSQSATEKYPHWGIVSWAVRVMESDLAWPVKKALLRARLLHDEIASKPQVRRQFEEPFEEATWRLRDAERSFLAPVRHDNTAHVLAQSSKSLDLLGQIRRRVELRERCQRAIDSVLTERARWLGTPPTARDPAGDSVCQLFSATEGLDRSLRTPTSDATLTAAVNRVEALRSVGHHLAGPVFASVSPAHVLADGKRYENTLSATRIRIRRSSGLLNLLQRDQTAPRSTELRRSAEQTDTLLQQVRLSDQKAMRSIEHYLRQARSVRSETPLGESGDVVGHHNLWMTSVTDLAADAIAAQSDASESEINRLREIHARCRRLASQSDRPIMPWPSSSPPVVAHLEGSLAESSEVYMTVTVPADSHPDSRLEVEVDPNMLRTEVADADRVSVSIRDAGAVSYRTVATQKSDGSSRSSATNRTATNRSTGMQRAHVATFRIARLNRQRKDTAINVRWITRHGVRRTTVPVQMPTAPLADVWLRGPDDAASQPPTGDWILRPNESSTREIWVRSRDQARKLSVTLLGLLSDAELPSGSVSNERAKRWRAETGNPTVLGQSVPLHFDATSLNRVLFPPEKLDPKTPAKELLRLVVQLDDVDNGRTQFVAVAPEVSRPSAMVRPSVSVDAQTQIAEVTVAHQTTPGADGAEPIRLRFELMDLADRSVFARGEKTVRGGQTSTVRFSLVGCNGPLAALRVTVQEWPSAFVYAFPIDQTVDHVSLTERHLATQIVDSDRTVVVGRQRSMIAVDVATDLSDDLFQYGSDRVCVGIDLNGDRELENEPTWTHGRPVDVRFTWGGVTPKGAIALHSHVGPQRFRVPTDGLVEGRYKLLAKLVRGDKVVWGGPQEWIVDTTAPTVAETNIVSALPAVLTQPLRVDVRIDDQGMSGAANVETGWAIGGELDFQNVAAVAAQRLADGVWAAVVPTDKLASGKHLLLVRAIDRAGNVSDVRTVEIELLTAAEIADRKNSQTAPVRGRIAFVKRPVPGMKVTLAIPPADDDGAESTAEPKPAQPNGKTQVEPVTTDSDGRFLFPAVRAGDYEMTVAGMYRGMNYRKTVPVTVVPPTPTDVPALRID